MAIIILILIFVAIVCPECIGYLFKGAIQVGLFCLAIAGIMLIYAISVGG